MQWLELILEGEVPFFLMNVCNSWALTRNLERNLQCKTDRISITASRATIDHIKWSTICFRSKIYAFHQASLCMQNLNQYIHTQIYIHTYIGLVFSHFLHSIKFWKGFLFTKIHQKQLNFFLKDNNDKKNLFTSMVKISQHSTKANPKTFVWQLRKCQK